MTDRPFTPEEWAEHTQQSLSNTWRLLRSGKVPGAVRIGRRWYIPRNYMDRMEQSMAAQAGNDDEPLARIEAAVADAGPLTDAQIAALRQAFTGR